MRWLSIVFVLFAALLPGQEKVRFSNWQFDLPVFMRKGAETEATLGLRLMPEFPGPGATFTLRAGRKTGDTAKQEVEKLWRTALGTRKPAEDPVDEEVELPDGTKGVTRCAPLTGDGWLLVGAYAPKGGLASIVVDAGDGAAKEMSIMSLMMIHSSLAFGPADGTAAPEEPTPAAADEALPAPTPLPPDPSEGIDWGARADVVRTIGDTDSIEVESALGEFVTMNRGLLGGVAPRELDPKTALQRVRDMLRLEQNAEAVRFLRGDPSVPDADAAQRCATAALVAGKPAHALLTLFVAHERWPDDLRVKFNLAALLARQGAVNEAMALLRDLRRGGEIFACDGPVSSGAQLAYLEAFCLTRIGGFDDAAALLGPIVAAEPFFGEAALLLALLEHKRGKPARRLFFIGHYRRSGGTMRHCGTGHGGIEDPPPAGEDDIVELVAEEFIDMTRGVPGRLPVPTLPSGIAASVAWAEWYEGLGPAWVAELQALSERLMEQRARWQEALPPDSPTLAWHWALDDILAEDRARLPEIHALRAAVEKAKDELSAAEDRTVVPLADKILQIAKRTKGDTAKACPEVQAAVLQAMDHLAGYTANLATAERRLFRLWHQYATAIGASVSDASFRAHLDTYIQHVRRIYRLGHFHRIYIWAQLAKYAEECTKKGTADDQDTGEDDELPQCDEEDKKHSLGIGMGPLSVEASCEGVSIEVEAPIFVDFLTMSVEASFGFDGSTTIYGGPKVKGKIPIVSSFSSTPSMKGGGYVKFQNGQVVDAGLRGEAKITTSAGPVSHGYKSERDLSFVPAPESPMGRSYGLQQYSGR